MKTYLTLSRARARRLSWQEILEDLRVLKSLCIKAILALSDGLTKEWCIATHLFIVSCRRISRGSGPHHLALYLKLCRVILMKKVAGDELPTTIAPAVSLTRGGLPRIIPAFHRKKIRQGDMKIVQFYLTLFSLSRLITTAKKISKELFASLHNPTDLGKVGRIDLTINETVRTTLDRYIPGLREIPLKQGFLFKPTWKTVPSSRDLRQCLSYGRRKCPDPKDRRRSLFTCLHSELAAFARLSDHGKESIFNAILGYPHAVGLLWPHVIRYPFDDYNFSISLNCYNHWMEFIRPSLPSDDDRLLAVCTGLLSQTLSGDGKRRLFAIGNYIKQRLLRPLHDFLMECLVRVPMDGTFDQTAPLDRLAGVKGVVYSIDLKAATDRWPLPVLSTLITTIFDAGLAAAAVNGCLGSNAFTPTFTKSEKLVRFQVGTPLGYYASWPLFALSHHMLVWHCAEQVYPSQYFDKYAVLGDDIVIADERVATLYLFYLEQLGVQVSPLKTMRSEVGACEFARRFRVNRLTLDLSPLSLVAVADSAHPKGYYGLLSLLDRFPLRRSTLMRVAGFGHKVASRHPGDPQKGAPRLYSVMLHHWHHRRNVGLSMVFTCHFGVALAPEVIGRIYFRLLQKFKPKELQLPPRCPFAASRIPDMEEFLEYSLYQGWMRQYLDYLLWYVKLVEPEEPRLDSFLDAPMCTYEWHAREETKVDSLGLTFMMYNWVAEAIRRPIRLLPVRGMETVKGVCCLEGEGFVVFFGTC